MRRVLWALLPFVLAASGCSIAAAAAGANHETVQSLAELDGMWLTGLASAIGAVGAAAMAEGQGGPPTPEDAHMCWLDADGGVEIYALDEVHAEALCRASWGEHPVCRCEWIGGRQAPRE